jgi:hypothetical protein
MTTIPKWCWWNTGECVVEVLHTGHFPTSVIVKLPNGNKTEVEISELRIENGTNT